MALALFILFDAFWIVLLAVEYLPSIRGALARRGMMDHIYTAHGRIEMYYHDMKSSTYSAPAGYSITSGGNYIEHYAFKEGIKINGFKLEFFLDAPINGSYTLWLYSLRKDQTNPFLTCPREKRTGTVSYAKDKNGKLYLVSFTPDA